MEFSTYEEFANRKKFSASECIKHIFLLEGSLYVPVSGLCLSASNSAFSSCFGMPEWNSTSPLGSGNRGLWRREGPALSCQPVSVSTYTQMCYLHTSQLNPPAAAPGVGDPVSHQLAALRSGVLVPGPRGPSPNSPSSGTALSMEQRTLLPAASSRLLLLSPEWPCF